MLDCAGKSSCAAAAAGDWSAGGFGGAGGGQQGWKEAPGTRRAPSPPGFPASRAATWRHDPANRNVCPCPPRCAVGCCGHSTLEGARSASPSMQQVPRTSLKYSSFSPLVHNLQCFLPVCLLGHLRKLCNMSISALLNLLSRIVFLGW